MFKKAALVVALALALSSGVAMAQGNWYFGGSVGQASVDLNDIDKDIAAELRDNGATGVSSSSDDTDTSWKLYGGYRFNKNFAIEGGYADFGKFDAKGSGTITGVPVTIKGSVESYAVFVDAVGILPLNDSFSVFGKAGAAYTHTKLKAKGSAGGFTISESESDNEVVPKLGIGAEYNVTKTVAVRAEYEHYFNVGDDNKTGESDVGVWSLGVKIGF